jgi:hypothetical protein
MRTASLMGTLSPTMTTRIGGGTGSTGDPLEAGAGAGAWTGAFGTVKRARQRGQFPPSPAADS